MLDPNVIVARARALASGLCLACQSSDSDQCLGCGCCGSCGHATDCLGLAGSIEAPTEAEIPIGGGPTGPGDMVDASSKLTP